MNYEIAIQLLVAALWGGIVGAEREYRSKSAGFRTMIMISTGSCFFTIMSLHIGVQDNVDRIASNIVTGIGFLGAGVIFRAENRVSGITTAATIWTVAAVGMGIGAGYYFAAATACILVLLILAVLPYVENLIDDWNISRSYSITCGFFENVVNRFEEHMSRNKLYHSVLNQSKDGNNLTTTWLVQGHKKDHQKFIDLALADPSIEKFEY